jgi:Na+/proline symporter
LSIAATWIWAPALFIASREAYSRGIAGLFWFTTPNVACLVLFAFFADRIRDRMPEGFTLSAYIGVRFSRRVQRLYWAELTGLAVCSFAVQLLAGGTVVAVLTGLPFFGVTLALATVALAYSLFAGIRASVVTDVAQMVLILAVGFTLVPWATIEAGGIPTVRDGLAGRSGEFGSLWSGKGLDTAFAFGIPVTVGLLAGPFGDQSFWQRAFAIRKHQVKPAFILGALIFGLVPLLLSLLGFIAAGRGWETPNAELVGVDVVLRVLPGWVVLPFVCMLISGLASTLDSNLCAISSIAAHDLLAESDREPSRLRAGRAGMFALAVASVAIANIPDMEILYLFLFYGTLRASTFLPTVLALSRRAIGERGMFYGILTAFVLGLPVFAAGNFLRIPWLAVVGSLLTIVCSGGIVWLGSIGISQGRDSRPR